MSVLHGVQFPAFREGNVRSHQRGRGVDPSLTSSVLPPDQPLRRPCPRTGWRLPCLWCAVPCPRPRALSGPPKEGLSRQPGWKGLGPVDSHEAATGRIPAAKLAAVLSQCAAVIRNSLALGKKPSTGRRHPYISLSRLGHRLVPFRRDHRIRAAPLRNPRQVVHPGEDRKADHAHQPAEWPAPRRQGDRGPLPQAGRRRSGTPSPGS